MGRLGRRLAAAAVALALIAMIAGPAAGEEAPARDTIGFGELEEEWRGEVVHLSWKPRALLFKKFLSDEECEHIKGLARPHLKVSDVVDSDTGEFVASKVRTSTGMFLQQSQDAVVSRVEKRVAQVTMTPVENQEDMQVLRYVNGQKYDAHYDYFHDERNKAPEVGGQRLVTALMYLSTPEEGGETVFPDSETQTPREGLSGCVRRGLANVPSKGDLLVFYALTPDGREDPSSLHESCPTLKGEKWSATLWIHVAKYRGLDEPVKRPPCGDENDMCAEWAFFGECDKNPAYMLESCKSACKLCNPDGTHKDPSKAPAPLKQGEQ